MTIPFESMNALQRRLHNAACVSQLDDEYGFAQLQYDAIDEIEQLRTELAEHKRRSSEDQADAANAWAKCQALEYAQALARKLNIGGAA